MYYEKNHVVTAAVSVDYDTAGDNTLFTPGEVVDIKRLIHVCTEQSAGSSIGTLKLQNADGSGSVTLGTYTIAAGIVVNAIRFVDIIKPKTTPTTGVDGSSVLTTSGAGLVRVKPGQKLVVTSDGVGTAGIFNVYVEYEPVGFNEKAAASPDGYAPTEIAFTAA